MQLYRAFLIAVPVVLSMLFTGLFATNQSMARTVVSNVNVKPGSILISTSKRKLYYGIGKGKAIQYRVGVGRQDKQWFGSRYIRWKAKKPAWKATADILKDKPHLTGTIPGGARNNPMGAAALLISGGGQYAIHGTNRPGSVGGFVSYGCIRMYNKDILDLYSRVGFGTRVVVKR